MLSKYALCSLQISPWWDANQYGQCTAGSWSRENLLVSRCNFCSLRSIIDWFEASCRQQITLLWKQWIHPIEILYPGPVETFKVFGRWTHKVSLLSECSNHFSDFLEVSSFSPVQVKFIGLLCKCIANPLKGNLQCIKRHHLVNFLTKVWLLFLKTTFGSSGITLWAPKNGCNLEKSGFLPSVVICFDLSSSFSSVSLCTRTRVWLLSQLPTSNFQSKELTNISRSKTTR